MRWNLYKSRTSKKEMCQSTRREINNICEMRQNALFTNPVDLSAVHLLKSSRFYGEIDKASHSYDPEGAHWQINEYSINSFFPTWTSRDSSKIEETASADPAIRLQRIGQSGAYWNNAPVLVGSAGIASGFQHYSWHFQEIQSGKVSTW